MPKYYSEAKVIEMLKRAINCPWQLYNDAVINWKGDTNDSKVPYSVIIARWLKQYFSLADAKCVPSIRDNKPFYSVTRHDKIKNKSKIEKAIKKRGGPRYKFQAEELLAINLYNSGLNYAFGKVLDYQVPLKENRHDNVGKIDLVTGNNNKIHLIELKKYKSEETLLRCIMEIYTYSSLMIRNHKLNKLIDEYIKKDVLNKNTEYIFVPTVLIFKNSYAGEELENKENIKPIKELVDKLNAEGNNNKMSHFEFFIVEGKEEPDISKPISASLIKQIKT